jgi:hypothetical protein
MDHVVSGDGCGFNAAAVAAPLSMREAQLLTDG